MHVAPFPELRARMRIPVLKHILFEVKLGDCVTASVVLAGFGYPLFDFVCCHWFPSVLLFSTLCRSVAALRQTLCLASPASDPRVLACAAAEQSALASASMFASQLSSLSSSRHARATSHA